MRKIQVVSLVCVLVSVSMDMMDSQMLPQASLVLPQASMDMMENLVHPDAINGTLQRLPL
jgi:hypothetical protein